MWVRLTPPPERLTRATLRAYLRWRMDYLRWRLFSLKRAIQAPAIWWRRRKAAKRLNRYLLQEAEIRALGTVGMSNPDVNQNMIPDVMEQTKVALQQSKQQFDQVERQQKLAIEKSKMQIQQEMQARENAQQDRVHADNMRLEQQKLALKKEEIAVKKRALKYKPKSK